MDLACGNLNMEENTELYQRTPVLKVFWILHNTVADYVFHCPLRALYFVSLNDFSNIYMSRIVYLTDYDLWYIGVM